MGSDDTRARIISATNELFRRSGYHGTGLAAIGRLANATTGSIYHFFPKGKSELARAVVLETGHAYGELFTLITAEFRGDPALGIQAFFDAAADTLELDDYVDPCPIGTVAREVASSDDELRDAADSIFSLWAELLASYLSGTEHPSEDDMEVATAIIGMLEGGFILARVRRDARVLRSVGARAAELVGLHDRARAARST